MSNRDQTPDRSDFARAGHAVRQNLISAEELAPYAEAIRSTVFDRAGDRPPMAERTTYGKAFVQVENLWTHSADVAALVLDERFARQAAALLGADRVRIYHDQALFKEPGGGVTPAHQDQGYWPLSPPDNWPDGDPFTVTMWMPLVDVPADMGTLSFASGSHRLGFLGDHVISDESEAVFAQLLADRGLEMVTHGALSAGDATFHAGWTLHRAPGNPTTRMREVMTVIYMADGTRVAEPMTDPQRNDLARFLPALVPGDVVSGPSNPLAGTGVSLDPDR